MNAIEYKEVLKGRLLSQLREWYGENPWLFQQDSALCHTVKAARRCVPKMTLNCSHELEIHFTGTLMNVYGTN